MPTVEKVSGGQVYVRGIGRFRIGDQADVSEDNAAYLCEERGDFERVTEATDGEFTPADSDEGSEPEGDEDADDDICGYEKDDGSVCQRTGGWGRDVDTGRCSDHVED